MKGILKPILILILIIGTSGCLSDIHLFEDTTNAKVEKKFIDVSKQGSHYILVTDKGQFEVNRPFFDIFNGSRNPDLVYSKIEENKTYKLLHFGFRFDIDYNYPIVVQAVEINTNISD